MTISFNDIGSNDTLICHRPKVRPLHNCGDLSNLLHAHKIYFIYFGPIIPGEIVETIDDYHAHNWFYESKMVCPGYSEGLYAIKGAVNGKITVKFDNDTHAIADWIRQHRFPQFVKITPGNFHLLLHSGTVSTPSCPLSPNPR